MAHEAALSVHTGARPPVLRLPATVWRICYLGSVKARRHPRAATAHNSIRDSHGMHPWCGMWAPRPFESEGCGLRVRLPHRLAGRTVSVQRAQSILKDILDVRTLSYAVLWTMMRRSHSTKNPEPDEATHPMSLQTNERTILISTYTSFSSFCALQYHSLRAM